MPNHITNEIIFRDITDEQHAAISAATLNAEGEVDFKILLPVPINAWMGNVGSNHQAAFKLTALDWCTEHWGTKWNAYSHRQPVYEGGTLTLVFDTAWRPPYGWLAALFNTVNISFDHNWLDEGAEDGVIGRFAVTPDGLFSLIEWKERPAEPEETHRLSVLKWGEATAQAILEERAQDAASKAEA